MIFPSTLIISADVSLSAAQIGKISESIGNPVSANNPDIYIINDQTGWGIAEIRKIASFLSQKPYSHSSKLVIIYEAHKLNTEAQNSLLKTLEEPGDNNYLILTSTSPSALLPTILSRCQIIHLNSGQKSQFTGDLLVISPNIKENLLLAETLAKDKDSVLPYLQNQLGLYQQKLLNDPDTKNVLIIKKIIKAIQMVKANVDPKSALDYLFLS